MRVKAAAVPEPQGQKKRRSRLAAREEASVDTRKRAGASAQGAAGGWVGAGKAPPGPSDGVPAPGVATKTKPGLERKQNICEHGGRKRVCTECQGSGVCEHKCIRSKCKKKECHGSQLCEHKRLRSYCKECKCSQVCEHTRSRARATSAIRHCEPAF